MIAAQESVTIGDHTMFANGCFVGDAEHRFDDPEQPITWQGFTSKGPVEIGANCWFGVNCAVTSGVSVGERCVVGANSVVNRDLPGRTICAGAPAKPIREIDFAAPLTGDRVAHGGTRCFDGLEDFGRGRRSSGRRPFRRDALRRRL